MLKDLARCLTSTKCSVNYNYDHRLTLPVPSAPGEVQGLGRLSFSLAILSFKIFFKKLIKCHGFKQCLHAAKMYVSLTYVSSPHLCPEP